MAKEILGEQLSLKLTRFYPVAQGGVFHACSTYARGLDTMIGAYNWLDIAPKGRDEDELEFSMSWVRHHDSHPQN